jgi:hypothetical protein
MPSKRRMDQKNIITVTFANKSFKKLYYYSLYYIMHVEYLF